MAARVPLLILTIQTTIEVLFKFIFHCFIAVVVPAQAIQTIQTTIEVLFKFIFHCFIAAVVPARNTNNTNNNRDIVQIHISLFRPQLSCF